MDTRQWEAARKPRVRARRTSPFLDTRKDSKAMQSWRNQEEATDTVRMPQQLALHPEKVHCKLADEYDTFLFALDRKANGGSIEFGIWGDDDGVASTKKAILEVIRDL
jgi:hypothetical protein